MIRLKAVHTLNIILVSTLVVSICYFVDLKMTPVYTKSTDEYPLVVQTEDGVSYVNYVNSGWRPNSKEKMIGRVGWKKNFGRFVIWSFKNAVYSVKDDTSQNSIIIQEPMSEFTMWFHRSDYTIPELSESNINGFEYVKNGLLSERKVGENRKEEREIIRRIFASIGNEPATLTNISSSYGSLYLYSDLFPGNAYTLPLILCEDNIIILKIMINII